MHPTRWVVEGYMVVVALRWNLEKENLMNYDHGGQVSHMQTHMLN